MYSYVSFFFCSFSSSFFLFLLPPFFSPPPSLGERDRHVEEEMESERVKEKELLSTCSYPGWIWLGMVGSLKPGTGNNARPPTLVEETGHLAITAASHDPH